MIFTSNIEALRQSSQQIRQLLDGLHQLKLDLANAEFRLSAAGHYNAWEARAITSEVTTQADKLADYIQTLEYWADILQQALDIAYVASPQPIKLDNLIPASPAIVTNSNTNHIVEAIANTEPRNSSNLGIELAVNNSQEGIKVASNSTYTTLNVGGKVLSSSNVLGFIGILGNDAEQLFGGVGGFFSGLFNNTEHLLAQLFQHQVESFQVSMNAAETALGDLGKWLSSLLSNNNNNNNSVTDNSGRNQVNDYETQYNQLKDEYNDILKDSSLSPNDKLSKLKDLQDKLKKLTDSVNSAGDVCYADDYINQHYNTLKQELNELNNQLTATTLSAQELALKQQYSNIMVDSNINPDQKYNELLQVQTQLTALTSSVARDANFCYADDSINKQYTALQKDLKDLNSNISSTINTVSSYSLNVPHIDQLSYSGKYGTAFGENICGATSLTMALQTFLGSSITLNHVVDEMVNQGELTTDGLNDGYSILKFIEANQSEYRVKVEANPQPTLDPNWLAEQIASNKVVIAQVPGHYTIITGYKINPDGSYEFQIEDPYRRWKPPNINLILNNEWVSANDLAKTWNASSGNGGVNNNNHYITTISKE